MVREDPTDNPPSVTISFTDIPMAAFPSSIGAPDPVPMGGQGSSGPILICHSIDPTMYPGMMDNMTVSAIPLDPAPTSSPPVPMVSAPVPTGSQGPRGPIYICHPIDPSASPLASVPPSNAPSVSIPMGTGIPQSMPTDSQGSRGSIYVCYPTNGTNIPGTSPSDATMTLSGPVPTSTPATIA